ncbi:MAG: TRAP transporter small permease [Lachnospiraceae bacterium]|nr:TRAP transporter small permease [Lachnospiraceae bacterium]
MEFIKKLDEVVAKILRVIVVLCVALIALILMFRVLIRFTPINISLSWTDEIVEWSMAYMIFLTSALIMRDGEHFRVDLLQEKFKGTTFVRILNVFIALVTAAFFTVFLYYAWDLFAKAQAPTIILRAPRQVPYASILIGGFLIFIYSIRDIVVSVKLLLRGEDQDKKEEESRG